MTEEELKNIIAKLKQEDEIPYVEVKHNFDEIPKIGETISALANSASYYNEEFAYFIWGLEDKTWKVVGTSFNLKKEINFKYKEREVKSVAKMWLLSKMLPTVYLEDFEFIIERFRAYVLKIKNCENKPVYFDKIAYIRIDSHNQELLKNTEIHKQILNKNQNYDWSALPCEGATIEDLDEEALEIARIGYIQKQYPNNFDKAEEIKNCDTYRFLDQASLLDETGQITNTAMLLLGKKESSRKLDCGFAMEISHRELVHQLPPEEFTIPFQKTIDKVVDKINIKKLEFQTKITGEYTGNNYFLDNYDKTNLRECVANCIAHQDYSKREGIVIYETIHQQIVFENAGNCLYSKDEFNQIRIGRMTPKKYRNEFLAKAMREIGLMENKGSGHQKMYKYNTKKVYLPLPEVDWNNQKEFVLTIYGASLDEKFTEILQAKTNLESTEILLLDQVQKGFKLDQKIFNNLKKQGLVEGSPTKGKLSFEFMKKIGKVDDYIDKSEDEHLKILIYKKIKQTKKCTRESLEDFIYPKFSKNLTDKQKYIKLKNMLSILKNEGWVDSGGGRRYAVWTIKKEMRLE